MLSNVIRILLLLACAYAGSTVAEMQLEASVSPSLSTSMANQRGLPSIHARAICDEIGTRLGCVVRPDHDDLHPRLRDLLDRVARMEDEAPSLIPSIENMARPLLDAA